MSSVYVGGVADSVTVYFTSSETVAIGVVTHASIGGGAGGTPADGTVTPAKFAAGAIDPAAGVAGARTLGSGSTQAASGAALVAEEAAREAADEALSIEIASATGGPATAEHVVGGFPGQPENLDIVVYEIGDYPDGLISDGVIPGVYDAANLPSITSAREDVSAIVGGLLGTTGRVGPDFPDVSFDGTTSGGRFYVYFDGKVGENFVVWAVGHTDGSPAVCINVEHTDQAIGVWNNPALTWWELGVIGRSPYDFRYMDTNFDTMPTPDANTVVALKVCRGYVSGYYGTSTAGVVDWGSMQRVVGPAKIPESLRYARMQGWQNDQATTSPIGFISRMGVRHFQGLATSEAVTPNIASQSITKGSGTSIVVTKPTGVVVGDHLVMVISTNAKAVTTPAGWTLDTSTTTGNCYIYVFHRLADASDVSATNYSVTYVSGNAAAVMMRVHGANIRLPVLPASRSNTSSTSAAYPSIGLYGRHRRAILVAASINDTSHTTSTGFTALTATTPGGTAITMSVSIRDWDFYCSDGDGILGTPGFGNQLKQVTPSSITLGAAAASATAVVTMSPELTSEVL